MSPPGRKAVVRQERQRYLRGTERDRPRRKCDKKGLANRLLAVPSSTPHESRSRRRSLRVEEDRTLWRSGSGRGRRDRVSGVGEESGGGRTRASTRADRRTTELRDPTGPIPSKRQEEGLVKVRSFYRPCRKGVRLGQDTW